MDQPCMSHTDLPPNTATPPPSYSPSISSTPSYTAEPSSDEESLELAIRPRTPIPRGKFTVKAGDIVVTLHEQEFGAGIPTYRQNTVIKGDVEITPNSNQRTSTTVISVAIRLVGRQVLETSGVGRHERLLFSDTHDLWARTPPLPLSQECSTPLPTIRSKFHVPFPMKFVDKSYAHPLVVPPTFEVKFLGERGFSARNEYTLSVVVKTERMATRTTKYDSTTLPILLNYRPRSRPYLPIATPLLPFFRTIKSAPEEWFQVSSLVPSKNGGREPMDCHLFIPRAQIYALTDTIPFHVQLRGTLESIQKFAGLDPTRTGIPAHSSNQSSIPSSSPRSPFEPRIGTDHSSGSKQVRVYLLRQISMQVKGTRASKDVILGEGNLKPVVNLPPFYSYSNSADNPRPRLQVASRATRTRTLEQDDDPDYSLDWEGEVRCDDNVLVPSFVSGDLHVKDSIVVHLRPVDSRVIDHLDHRYLHTIRFVTDKYRDVHPSDE